MTAAEYLRKENRKYTEALEEIPKSSWPSFRAPFLAPSRVWRSKSFLVQLYEEERGTRLTINRTTVNEFGWAQGISWDELQRLKAQTGFGESWAVEIFPPDSEVVNVSNMRHIWILPEPPAFGWKRGKP